jgi:type III secretion protein I
MIGAVAAVAQVAATAAPLPAVPSVDRNAATQFAQLLIPETPPVARAEIPAAISRAFPAASAVSASSGLGDSILRGLNGVQNGFNDTVAAVTRSLESSAATPSVQDLLRMQMAMAQLSVQVELAGKAIGRSTQNLDQLVRMQ